MASATPDLRLPPPPATGHHRPVTGTKLYSWWQRHKHVNNLPKVVTWKRKAGSRTRDLRSRKSNALTTRPPGQTISPTTRLKCQFLNTVGEGLVLCVQRKSSFLQSPDWSHVANPSRCQFCRSEHHLSADQLYPELPAALQLALTQFPPLDRPKYRAHRDYPIGPGLQREVWQFLLALPA